MQTWPSKDADEVKDYYVDWARRLAEGETIIASTFFVEEGSIELENPEIEGARCKVWVTGGVTGERAVVVNRVTTSEGRIYDSTQRLTVRRH